MSHELSEEECGLTFGTEIVLIRPTIKTKSETNSQVWFSLSGERSTPINLKFDRAGYNHLDGLYAYCFKLPSGEELWIEFSDELTTSKRLEILREFMRW
ncbi:MAG: hypothetical protein SGJ02_11520 [bacterium]|nr:hypothetical protein [bacterium]